MKKPFIKMHGLGNDFVVIDSTKNQYTINKSSIQLISDRRFGVGCDQVIEMKPSAKEDIYMKIEEFSQAIHEANEVDTRLEQQALNEYEKQSNKNDVYITKRQQSGVYDRVELEKQRKVSIAMIESKALENINTERAKKKNEGPKKSPKSQK